MSGLDRRTQRTRLLAPLSRKPFGEQGHQTEEVTH